MSSFTDTLSISAGSAAVIEVVDLRKSFGDTTAVDGLSFSVAAGSITAVLGPNGAGKTTTIRMLSTQLPIDGGRATVAGFDVSTEPEMVRRTIGLAGQSAAVDAKLTTRQNLDLFGRLYHLPSAVRRQRVDGLVERFDMGEYAGRLAGDLSGGQRRRLDLVAALIADPPVVFLDEPTSGLDPRGRLALWDQIRSVRDGGAAVVLTTQYLEEADRLADRILVIDEGRAVAQGSAAELKARLERDVLEITLADAADRTLADAVLCGEAITNVDGQTVHLAASSAADSVATLRRLQDSGVAIADFQLRKPTLDDVFIELTGVATGRDRVPEASASSEVSR